MRINSLSGKRENLQVRRHVMLPHRVMFEIQQDFRADIFRDVFGDQHEMQLALVVALLLAANQRNRRPQDERKRRSTGRAGCSSFITPLSPSP
jgi:hypothetical protein